LKKPGWVQEGGPSCARRRSEGAAAVEIVVVVVDVATDATPTVLSLAMALIVVRQARWSAAK
jgi:hypothetical protein